MRPAAILLDLDGTLADTLPGLTLTANRLRADRGLAPVRPAQVRTWVGEGAPRFVARALTGAREATEASVPADVLTGALADFHAIYAACQHAGLRLYPGARLALEGLARARIALACITNKPRAHALAMLDALGIARYFASVVTPEDGHGAKPAPGPLSAACRALGAAPRAAVMVGDGLPDIAAARAAGCPVVAVRYGYGGRAAGTADAAVHSLAELGHVACWLLRRHLDPPSDRAAAA